MTRIFVYGTFKKGGRNHHYLDGAVYEGATRTATPDYVMVEFNARSQTLDYSWPGLYKAQTLGRDGGYIHGEVYSVNAETLAKMDALERVGISYNREKVRLADGTFTDMYIKITDTRDYVTQSPRIQFDAEDRSFNWI